MNSLTGGAPLPRRRIVRAVVAVAREHDGVTLDIEELRPHQREEFTALVRAVGRRVRRLAVYVTREGAAYDWRAIACHADLLLASGYNEHWSGSKPGPITTSRGFAAVADRAVALARPGCGLGTPPRALPGRAGSGCSRSAASPRGGSLGVAADRLWRTATAARRRGDRWIQA